MSPILKVGALLASIGLVAMLLIYGSAWFSDKVYPLFINLSVMAGS